MANITIANMDSGSYNLKVGDTGTAVTQVRTYLASAGYTSAASGAFSTTDTDRVSSFQSAFGLKIDGVCGYNTWKRLQVNYNCKQTTATSQTSTLMKYAPSLSSSYVRQLQNNMISVGYSMSADSYFGSTTLKFVLHFQATHSLAMDGIVGNAFLSKLNAILALSSVYKDNGKPCIGIAPRSAGLQNQDIVARLLYGEANNTDDGRKSVGQVLCNRNGTSPWTAASASGQFTSVCEPNNTGASPDRTSAKWQNAVTFAGQLNANPGGAWHSALKSGKYLNFNSSGVPSGVSKIYPNNPIQGNYFYTK